MHEFKKEQPNLIPKLFWIYCQNAHQKHYLLRFSQDTWSQPQGYPLQRPLTPVQAEDARTALEIYKLVGRKVLIPF